MTLQERAAAKLASGANKKAPIVPLKERGLRQRRLPETPPALCLRVWLQNHRLHLVYFKVWPLNLLTMTLTLCPQTLDELLTGLKPLWVVR